MIMRKTNYLILYITFGFLCVGCKSGTYEIVDYYENGQKKYIQYFENQEELIKELELFQNGDTSELIIYRNNQEYSRYIYDTLTNSKYYLEYKDSLLHGIARKIDKNNYTFISHFNNGVLHGREVHLNSKNDTTKVLWWINGTLLLVEEIDRLNIGDTIQNLVTVGDEVIQDSIKVIDKKENMRLLKEYYLKGKKSQLVGWLEYNNDGQVNEDNSNYYSLVYPKKIKYNNDLIITIHGHFSQYNSFKNLEVIIGNLKDDFSIDSIANKKEGEVFSQLMSLSVSDLKEGYNVITGVVVVDFKNELKTLPLVFDVNVVRAQ